MQEDEEKYRSATTHKLPSKGIWGHTTGALRHWRVATATFAASLVALVGFTELAVKLTGAELSYPKAAPFMVLLTGVIALWRLVDSYFKDIPECLRKESREAQRAYFLQRPGWQFRLASCLLEDRLRGHDMDMGRIADGARYVCGHRSELLEYIRWMQDRPGNVCRLLHAACKTMIERFPLALQGAEGKPDPHTILQVVEEMTDIYRESVAFEEEAKAIIPPEPLQSVHELSYGWTEPVREGMQKILRFLRHAGMIEYRSTPHLELNLVFDAPPQVTRFSEELGRIRVDELILNS